MIKHAIMHRSTKNHLQKCTKESVLLQDVWLLISQACKAVEIQSEAAV